MFTSTSRVVASAGSSRVVLALGVVGSLLVGSAALAAPVAPLVPKMTPAKAEEIVVRFHDALAKGLGEGGLEPLSTAHVRGKAKGPCAASACALRALRALGSDTAVAAKISTVGKNYTIELLLFGAREAKVSGRCDICTLMEALSTTKKLAKELATKAAKTAVKTPTKTPVKTPTKTPAKTPAKTPVITKVTPPSSAAGPKREGRRWPLWPVLAAAGVGVLGLAVGIPLVSMDGDPTNCRGEPRPDGRNCQDVYSTSGAGWTFTTMGIAGLATAGVLLYLYLTSPKGDATQAEAPWLHRVTIAPAEGGLLMGARGTF